ncbi:unnamed protein product [Caenorhabditis bovis]|uniref:Uncharacterized protein n=1 Tax=Caenorhabditis bovis TaxID=2654633 RepID=A0A8S1FA48_9PELO|nr:unnamed protein product [Caenorhabditis bovis]
MNILKASMKKTEYKIVVFGDSASGKSALVKRFINNEFRQTYDPTIEDKYKTKFNFQNQPINLQIVDTSGKELMPGMLSRYIAYADAFIVCYSIGSRKSFLRAFHLFELISQKRQISEIARVLVGCKCDSEYREVYAEEGNDLSAQLQCSFAETSAAQNLNVIEVKLG